jgi:hypothetical protein
MSEWAIDTPPLNCVSSASAAAVQTSSDHWQSQTQNKKSTSCKMSALASKSGNHCPKTNQNHKQYFNLPTRREQFKVGNLTP